VQIHNKTISMNW